MNIGLSKSKYVTYCTCPKALWLRTYKPEVEVKDAGVESRFETGNEVGDLAMQYFGDFVEVTTYDSKGKLDLASMIKKTNDEIAKGTKVICEASFSYNSNYCAVDILKKNGRSYDIYEVKSSTSADKEVYLEDLAYQEWVLEQCGLKIKDVYLMHIDSEYVLGDKLDVKKLFKAEELNDKISNYYNEVAKNEANAKKMLQNSTEPSDKIGEHCFDPYNCGFFKYCTNDMKSSNVFDLYRMSNKKAAEYYNSGITTFEQMKNEKLSDIQKLQIDCELNNKEIIDKNGIKEFLNKVTYPLYFLDFETMQPAIPLYKGTHPYQFITFQYSLHYIDKKGGELKHKEFLGEPKVNPMEELAKQLVKDIPENVTVLAYNMAFEKTRIKEMSDLFPELKEHLMNIHDHIIDLIEPFRAGHYYNKLMNGSFSIKVVLPALFRDDPTLDYHNLSGSVHNGGEASDIFPKMRDMNKDDYEKARASLLEYCGLDTYAMVKILEKLFEVVK